MKRKVKLYIGDIIENMKLAQQLTGETDFTTFVEEKRIHYAVIRCIEIIGEAVKHVPDDFRLMYPSIPWKQMAGMRDMLIHFYMGVDFEIIWKTVQEQFPLITRQMEPIFSKMDD
jgi:uncharacterized protein with HEPN domain